MFSSLPKLADKNFVLGFLLPVLAGVSALLFVLRDLEPFRSIYEAALDEKKLSNIVMAAIAVWLLACLLLACNRELYRMLEGYTGPFRSERKRLYWQKHHDKLRAKFDAGDDDDVNYYPDLHKFLVSFPPDKNLVMPTRFGNVIRAFESYPYKVYGVDSIPTWPRLEGVIPKDFHSLLDDARAQVDFFLNLFWFSILIFIISILRLLFQLLIHFWDIRLNFILAGTAFAAFVLARLTYEGALDRARAWGDSVKSAFDLYLPTLASQLGYQTATTQQRREQFWDATNSMYLYLHPLRPEEWKDLIPPTPIEANAEATGPHPSPPSNRVETPKPSESESSEGPEPPEPSPEPPEPSECGLGDGGEEDEASERA
jgi:hypothetical protein